MPDRPALADVVRGFPANAHAVVDGAQFDDLPAVLSHEGLAARCLFRSPGDPRLERGGPWLVQLDPGLALDRLLSVVGERPAAVFWSCPGEILYGHLRRLNTARLPAWAARDEPGPGEDGEGDLPVMFRHWDPRVLGALMPVLDAAQFARVLGPAREMAYEAPEYGGVRRIVADPGWPPAPGGPLVVRTDQMLALTERRREVARGRVTTYLNTVFPEVAPTVPAAELDGLVRSSEVSGRALGIRTEAGHKRWAYLVMATNGQVTRTPGALDFIRNGRRSPDDQVRIMIDLLGRQVRRRGGTP